MYDKFSVLRIETTLCNPYEFKVPRSATRRQPQRVSGWVPGRRPKHPPQWVRMNKGVGNFWRYCDVGEQANARYLDALASAPLTRRAVDELDRVCRSHTVGSRRIARLNPVAAEDARLFSAVLQGQHLLNGFRNREVTQALSPTPPKGALEAQRRRERTSRLLAKLRGHHLIAKIPRSRRYRVTELGHRVMTAALRFRRAELSDLDRAAAA
jgi:hypothetical protein